MSLRRFVDKFLSIGSGRRPEISPDITPPLVEWPLPEALPVAPLKPANRFQESRKHEHWEHAGIHVFAYPFEQPEIAEIFGGAPWSSPEEGDVKDGKYCEVTSEDGTKRYIACRMMVDALRQAEQTAGKGLARLRLVALDCFGYSDEARALFSQFEGELSPPMAAMGFARVLLAHNHPKRALEVVESARKRGIAGASLAACQARMSFACGSVSDGVRLASEAIRSLPDPLWMPADHFYTWGLLHGAALASRRDSKLREVVLDAVRSLSEGEHPAKRALACANLAETAGDLSAATRYATVAFERAQGDGEVLAEVEWVLERVRGLAALVSRLNQSLASIDTRLVTLNMEGWSLDETGSNPGRSTWHDGDGDTLILTVGTLGLADTSDVGALRTYCRQLAESHGAGLVEANVVQGRAGLTAQLIYKNLVSTAFTFTGVQIVPLPKALLTWTVIAVERGMTGVREAVLTAQLMKQGRLTVQTYSESWAQDPYDDTYRGVDRSTLRYISDDASYDGQFPTHPLSKVRRLLRELSRRPDLGPVVPDPLTLPNGLANS